jgi:hypothetical protein
MNNSQRTVDIWGVGWLLTSGALESLMRIAAVLFSQRTVSIEPLKSGHQ